MIGQAGQLSSTLQLFLMATETLHAFSWLRRLFVPPPFMIPVNVVAWLSAGCPVMGILMGQCWPQKDYVTTLLLLCMVLRTALLAMSCLKIPRPLAEGLT